MLYMGTGTTDCNGAMGQWGKTYAAAALLALGLGGGGGSLVIVVLVVIAGLWKRTTSVVACRPALSIEAH